MNWQKVPDTRCFIMVPTGWTFGTSPIVGHLRIEDDVGYWQVLLRDKIVAHGKSSNPAIYTEDVQKAITRLVVEELKAEKYQSDIKQLEHKISQLEHKNSLLELANETLLAQNKDATTMLRAMLGVPDKDPLSLRDAIDLLHETLLDMPDPLILSKHVARDP